MDTPGKTFVNDREPITLMDRLRPAINILVLAMVPAIGSALVAIGKGERVEDKADAGFFYTRADVEASKAKVAQLEARLAQAEAEILTIKKTPPPRFIPAGKRLALTAPPTPTQPRPTPPPAAPLPVSLDDAVKKQESGVAPTPLPPEPKQ